MLVLVLVLAIEKPLWKQDKERIEYEYDDDIIADCVLPASNQRGQMWIALLVNFKTNSKIPDPKKACPGNPQSNTIDPARRI